jgi:hypothetical protein
LLSRCVWANDYGAFLKIIKAFGKTHFPDSLWADLATLHGLSRYQTAVLELPVRKPRIVLHSQTPVLMDDKKSGMTATIGGAVDMNPNELTARLKVRLQQKTEDHASFLWKYWAHLCSEPFSLPATALTFNEPANQLVVTFASVAASGRELDGQPTLELIRLGDSTKGPCAEGQRLELLPCLYVLKPPAAPAFELTTTAAAVVADGQGRGKLQVHLAITKTEKGVTLTLKGANVAPITPAPDGILCIDKDDSSKLVVKKSGVITLDLFNLCPTEKVVVGAADEAAKTSAPDITLSVVGSAGKSEKSAPANELK